MGQKSGSFGLWDFPAAAEKGSALKNLAGALHTEAVRCTLSVGREVKTEIPDKLGIVLLGLGRCAVRECGGISGISCSDQTAVAWYILLAIISVVTVPLSGKKATAGAATEVSLSSSRLAGPVRSRSGGNIDWNCRGFHACR
jgi:hypothetical protein